MSTDETIPPTTETETAPSAPTNTLSTPLPPTPELAEDPVARGIIGADLWRAFHTPEAPTVTPTVPDDTDTDPTPGK